MTKDIRMNRHNFAGFASRRCLKYHFQASVRNNGENIYYPHALLSAHQKAQCEKTTTKTAATTARHGRDEEVEIKKASKCKDV